MTKKINEASIKIDVNGLESDDFETLSRMLALAGKAEHNTGAPRGLAPLQPMDFDSIGGEDETQSIMDPADAMSQDSPAIDGGLDSAIDDLAGSVSDFGADAEDDGMGLDMDGQPSIESGSEFGDDFGDDVEDFSNETADADFDMDMMSRFAGLGESLIKEDDTPAEDVANDEVQTDDELTDAEEDTAADVLGENQLLPDLSLEEDSSSSDTDDTHGPYQSEAGARDDAEQATHGDFIIIPSRDGYYWKYHQQDLTDSHKGPYQSEVGARDAAEQATNGTEFDDFMVIRRPDGYYWSINQSTQDMYEDAGDVHNKPHGPFQTERQAVEDAQIRTNGVEGDNFAIVPQGNAYYWKRTVQEELQNEPEPSYYDNDGIENSRHNFSPKRNALGDNPLLNNVRESEEVDADNDDEEDDVESIYENISAQYEKFLGGLNGK